VPAAGGEWKHWHCASHSRYFPFPFTPPPPSKQINERVSVIRRARLAVKSIQRFGENVTMIVTGFVRLL